MSKTCFINLGWVEDIPIGQGVCFIVKEEEMAVFRLRNGRILAVENKCPHRGGPLAEGVIGSGHVVCPLHGHKFNLETGEGSDPKECVRVFKTRIEQGQIYLEYVSTQQASDLTNTMTCR